MVRAPGTHRSNSGWVATAGPLLKSSEYPRLSRNLSRAGQGSGRSHPGEIEC
jgi:hypothetical protein